MSQISIHILTLFPEFFEGPLKASLLGKAIEKQLMSVHCSNMRDFATDKHGTVDAAPYGGGSGMVIRPDIVMAALEDLPGHGEKDQAHRILLAPTGKRVEQADFCRWAQMDRIAFICGRYEGIDSRIADHHVDEQISLGDFVLSGGEVAALTMIEGLSRMIPGVLGNQESLGDESFSSGLLEYPHYTRPRTFRGQEVPEILLSGNHAKVDEWRAEQSLQRTLATRPDLLQHLAETVDNSKDLPTITSGIHDKDQ
jgi:tRNA (guanine37-N1)-methyltransferase